jgi:hypothetical protein
MSPDSTDGYDGQIPAAQLMDDGNPYKDAEFVIYQSRTDHVQYEPATEIAEETGRVGVGLWARYEDIEIPLFSRSEQGVWYSLSAEIAKNSDSHRVSDAFIQAVGGLTDEQVADGWLGVEPDVWERLSDAEQEIVAQFRHAIVGGSPAPECVLAVRECETRREVMADE